jgi:3-dehydroquinate synthase
VGGKTGVNHPSGKNLIGTFHQPALVLVDPELLSTLPRRDYTSGLYEALKYGIIRDPALFGLFEQRLDGLLERDAGLVEEVVFRCLRIKADIVGQDAREGNVRRILNFGHTIGHGIESALGYRRVRHGEAVGYGMIGVVRLARGLAKISAAEAGRIEAAVQAIGRLPSLAGLAPGDVLAAMAHDKKVRRGTLHFVIPRRIGDVSIEANVPVPAIRKAIRSLL